MKRLIRRPGVQRVLGWALFGYMWLMLRTIRWRLENVECVEPAWASQTGAVGLLWHGRIPLGLALGPVWWRRPVSLLISPSGDGEFIAQAMAHAGMPSIRGSTAKKGDSSKARATVAAFREALDWVSGPRGLIITPDGPRGPAEKIAPGALQIARRTGAPVFLIGVAAAPSVQADSWDRAMFALPFGRGAMVYDGPLHVPAEADEAMIERLLEDWSARLSKATRRAEALVGRRGD